MSSAADALEKLVRLERDLEKKCHDLGYYDMIYVGIREFVAHVDTLRAALAQLEAAALLRELFDEWVDDDDQSELTQRVRAFLEQHGYFANERDLQHLDRIWRGEA